MIVSGGEVAASSESPSYKDNRYPAAVIAHCVWLYFRFALSFREVDAQFKAVQSTPLLPTPFWDAMERAGGLVDSWGGGEFCYVLPRVLSFVQTTANP